MIDLGSRIWVNAHQAGDELLALAAGLGVGGVRVDANVYDLHPAPDVWEWAWLDRLLRIAKMLGLQVYPTLSYCPQHWSPDRQAVPPLDQWFTFCRMFAERYIGRIRYVGCWNEFPGTPEAYVDGILKPMAAAFKDISMDFMICGPDCPTMSGWPDWLYRCLVRGGIFLDMVTVHCYGDSGRSVLLTMDRDRPDWIPRWFPWPSPSVRQVMRWAGCAKPLSLTEFGWAKERYGEEAQADSYGQFFEDFGISSLSAAVAFQLIDDDHSSHGIFRVDRSPTRAAEVFKRWL